MNRAWIGLGGNVGDVRDHMRSALARLEDAGVEVARTSPLYETPPWGPVAQDRFLNACVEVHTSLSPVDLLAALHDAERALARTRDVRWGPRTIDLDLLAYEGFVSDDPALQVPHPRMHDRAFVLVPLADIAPDLRIGDEGVAELAARADRVGMKKLEGDWR